MSDLRGFAFHKEGIIIISWFRADNAQIKWFLSKNAQLFAICFRREWILQGSLHLYLQKKFVCTHILGKPCFFTFAARLAGVHHFLLFVNIDLRSWDIFHRSWGCFGWGSYFPYNFSFKNHAQNGHKMILFTHFWQ